MSSLQQMRLRQKVLADFGEFALRSDSLDEVLQEACRLVSEALETDFSKILEIEDGGEAALVKAGVGWRPDKNVVGRRLAFSERSSETYSLQLGEPVASQDITKETRFDFADFLLDHGVVSLVNAPIFLPGGKVYGLLQVDSRKLSEFGEDDIEFLRTYTAILGPVIDRLHKAHSLRLALEINERLLRELQHRVKNHIAIITSMVRVRANRTESGKVREELKEVGERIETLRLVNEQLYIAGSHGTLPMRPFLSQLVKNLCRLNEASGIDLRFDIADVHLDADAAVPIGLIANEFVTNSLKYAFEDGCGTICVSLKATEGQLRFCMNDNGKGLPENEQLTQKGSGTGLELIEALAHQLGAKPSWPATSRGTAFCLELKEE